MPRPWPAERSFELLTWQNKGRSVPSMHAAPLLDSVVQLSIFVSTLVVYGW